MFSFLFGVQIHVDFANVQNNSNLCGTVYANFSQSELKEICIMGSYTYQPGRLTVSSTDLLKGFPCILLFEFYTA
jgi:hypothetical protein